MIHTSSSTEGNSFDSHQQFDAPYDPSHQRDGQVITQSTQEASITTASSIAIEVNSTSLKWV